MNFVSSAIQFPITRECARPSWTKEAGEEEEVQSDNVAMLTNDTARCH